MANLTYHEQKDIENRAKQFGLMPSTYIHDTLFDEKTIKRNAKYLKCKQVITINQATDCVLELIARTESDYISKADLIPLIDNIKKGCDYLWKH